jgi:hypothetical protein
LPGVRCFPLHHSPGFPRFEGESVELAHLIEIQLAEGLTPADIARLERQVPGIGAAFSKWLATIE